MEPHCLLNPFAKLMKKVIPHPRSPFAPSTPKRQLEYFHFEHSAISALSQVLTSEHSESRVPLRVFHSDSRITSTCTFFYLLSFCQKFIFLLSIIFRNIINFRIIMIISDLYIDSMSDLIEIRMRILIFIHQILCSTYIFFFILYGIL